MLVTSCLKIFLYRKSPHFFHYFCFVISQKSIQDVIAHARVEEVVGDFVKLRRSGSNMKGLCPFHDEKTPSFMVSPSKNIYKCFGCQKGGNSIQFLMEVEKMSFVEAIRALAERYNIVLEETDSGNDNYAEEKKHKDSLAIVNQFAEKYFLDKLLNDEEGKTVGLSYFRERGYREATINKFGLGYATKARTDLKNEAEKAQYNGEFLRELGLVTERGNDFFNGRVMFTIHNLSGKPIAFAGRILETNKKAPKYINSPESTLYNKSKTLYGMYQAKNALRKENNCILVEGYTDVISLHQNGIENVVASSGTALTQGQLRLIKRFTDNLTILYDGDNAGIKAAMRGMDLALEQDLNARIALLPDGQDPDSYVKEVGHDEFKKYVDENAKDFILFKLDLYLEEAKDDPIKKSAIIREIVESIAKIQDRIKRSTYIQQASRHLGTHEDILHKEANKIIRRTIQRNEFAKERDKKMQENKSSAFDDGSSGPNPNGQPAGPIDSPWPEDKYDYEQQETEQYYEKKEGTARKQRQFETGDAYQEKDLVRIIITNGSDIIQDPEGNVTVAEYIYSSIVDVIEYFDNKTYKEIILDAIDRLEKGESITTDYFSNHQDPIKQKIAIDLMSSPHTYAAWDDKGVHLVNQPFPEKNYLDDSFQAIARFKYRKAKRILETLETKIKIASEEDDQERLKQLLLAYKQLQAEKIRIAEHRGIVIG